MPFLWNGFGKGRVYGVKFEGRELNRGGEPRQMDHVFINTSAFPPSTHPRFHPQHIHVSDLNLLLFLLISFSKWFEDIFEIKHQIYILTLIFFTSKLLDIKKIIMYLNLLLMHSQLLQKYFLQWIKINQKLFQIVQERSINQAINWYNKATTNSTQSNKITWLVEQQTINPAPARAPAEFKPSLRGPPRGRHMAAKRASFTFHF